MNHIMPFQSFRKFVRQSWGSPPVIEDFNFHEYEAASSSSSSSKSSGLVQQPRHYGYSNEKYEKIYFRADIRRGASLKDVSVNVKTICISKSYRIAYRIEMKNKMNQLSWCTGKEYHQIRAFYRQLVRYLEDCVHHSKECRATHLLLVVLEDANEVLRRRTAARALLSMGTTKKLIHHRIEWIQAFITAILHAFGSNIHELAPCHFFGPLLRMMEKFLDIPYYDDMKALKLIEQISDVQEEEEGEEVVVVDEECSICLEALFKNKRITPVKLSCTHQFHEDCLCIWFHTRLNCPMCRYDGL